MNRVEHVIWHIIVFFQRLRRPEDLDELPLEEDLLIERREEDLELLLEEERVVERRLLDLLLEEDRLTERLPRLLR